MTIALHVHNPNDTQTMGNCNQRSNYTMPKIHLLMNEFLRRVVCIWGRVKLCPLGLSCMV